MALLVITAILASSRQVPDAAPEMAYHDKCRAFAHRFGLSPREEEILRYLARGRGSTWIGEQLCISPDTVRTHCKRIYDKASVHGREQLIDAVEKGTALP